MSSRELIELLEPLRDESAFKTALRGGDWSMDRIIQTRIANELMASRYDGTDMQPKFIKTPGDEIAARVKDEHRRAAYHQAQAELTGKTRTRRREAVS